MSRRILGVLAVGLLGIGAGVWAMGKDAVSERPQTRPVALVTKKAVSEPADNSYCFTCHINFQEEFLAARHQKAGVGCAKCHGESDKHSSDEDGLTPPDVLFAKNSINDSCTNCHQPKKLIAKDEKHVAVLNGTATEKKYCTDCHSQHVMKVRTRRWDKVTRKLISDDGVRMVTEKKPAGK